MEEGPTVIKTSRGDYVVQRELGRGAGGVVYLVTAPAQGEPVALKVLSCEQPTGEQLQAFQYEFTVLSTLQHAHIQQVYNFGSCIDPAGYCFTSAWVDGAALYDAVAPGNFHTIEVIALQMLEALHVVHGRGLVHGDIKGTNIIARSTEQGMHSTLIDFGLVRAMQDDAARTGSMHYMAPELFAGASRSEARADLYALGVTLYRALTGAYPSGVETLEALLQWHRDGACDFEQLAQCDVPQYFIEWLGLLLHHNPMERFATAYAAWQYLLLHQDNDSRRTTRITMNDAVGDGPFTGREHIVQAAQALLRATVSHDVPRCLMVHGSHGMGKTRTLRELALCAQVQGYHTCEVNAQDADALQHLLSGSAITKVEELVERQGERALCLCIDDLHLANPALRYAVDRILTLLYHAHVRGECPSVVLLLGAEPQLALDDTFVAESFDLQPLTQHDVASWIQAWIGPDPRIEAWAPQLCSFSGGQPALLQPGLHALLQSDTDQLPVPQQLLAEQFSMCAPDAQLVLLLLARSAAPLSIVQLRELLPDAADTALHTLSGTGLIELCGQRGLIYLRQGAMQAYLNAQPLQPREIPCYRALLQDPALTRAARARYAELAGDTQVAADELAALMHEAEQLGDLAEALRRCTQLMQYRDDRELAHKQVRLLLLAGRSHEAEHAIHELCASHTALDVHDAIACAQAQGWLARLRRMHHEEAQFFAQALAHYESLPRDEDYWRVVNERAQAHFACGELDEAEQLFEQAAQRAPQLSNNNLGAVYSARGALEAAEQWYSDKIARFTAQPRVQASAYCQRAAIRHRLQHERAAVHDYEHAWQLMEAQGVHYAAATIVNNMIALHHFQGRFQDALRYAELASATSGAQGSTASRARLLVTIAQLYTAMHCHGIAKRYVEAARRCVAEHSTPELEALLEFAEGFVLYDLGHTPRARAHLLRARQSGVLSKRFQQWAEYGCGLELASLEQLVESGVDSELRIRAALQVIEARNSQAGQVNMQDIARLRLLQSECQQRGCRALLWEVQYVLGILLRRAKHYDDAEHALRSARTMIRDIVVELDDAHRASYLQHARVKQVSRDLALVQASRRQETVVVNTMSQRTRDYIRKVTTEAHREISAEQRLQGLLSVALEYAAADRAAVLVPAGTAYRAQYTCYAQTEVPAVQHFAYAHGIVRHVMAHHKAIFTTEVPDEGAIDLTRSIIALKIQSVACVPLYASGALVGMLYMDSQGHDQSYTADMSVVLELVADYVAELLVELQSAARVSRSEGVGDMHERRE